MAKDPRIWFYHRFQKTFYFQTVAWSLETKNIVPIIAKKLKTRTKCTACGASSVGR